MTGEIKRTIRDRIVDELARTGVRPETVVVTEDEAARLVRELMRRQTSYKWTMVRGDRRVRLYGVVLVDRLGTPFERDYFGLIRRRPK